MVTHILDVLPCIIDSQLLILLPQPLKLAPKGTVVHQICCVCPSFTEDLIVVWGRPLGSSLAPLSSHQERIFVSAPNTI
jgi:hypothetical protein